MVYISSCTHFIHPHQVFDFSLSQHWLFVLGAWVDAIYFQQYLLLLLLENFLHSFITYQICGRSRLFPQRFTQLIQWRRLNTTSTIIHKIFETNSSFHLKYSTTGKVQFLFFRRFLLVLTKFSFRVED